MFIVAMGLERYKLRRSEMPNDTARDAARESVISLRWSLRTLGSPAAIHIAALRAWALAWRRVSRKSAMNQI
jgi:hypothetical protein